MVTLVPLPGCRFQLDLAAVRLDELAGQRQAEAERRLAAGRRADAVEAGEHLLLVLDRDPRAVVGDGDIDACPRRPRPTSRILPRSGV